MTGRMICSREFWTKKTLIGLGLGQFLSLLITSTGFTSSELASKKINAPTSQSFLNYVMLAIFYGSIMLYRKQALKVIEVTLAEKARFLNGGVGWFLWFLLYCTVLLDEKDVTIFNLTSYGSCVLIIKAKWYYYILLGLVDVEANFLVVKAYQYTSLTSVMLLDCWSIPSVMLLTWIFLTTKYRYKKVAGVVVCVAGLVMVVFSDVHRFDRAGGSNPRKGDFLVIAGSTLYAVSNVSEEFLVKNADRVELMSFLGLFGAIISAIQISVLERSELKSIHWSAVAALPFIGFSVAMFLFYSLVPVLLKINGSTMLNLSLLTSDMWAVLIRIFAYHQKVDWMYFVAFAAVTLGLIIYSGGEKEEDQRRDEIADGESEQSKHFDEETGSRNLNRGTTAGSSKLGDNSKHGSTSSIGGREDVENRSLGKGTSGKLS